jgi:SAM-dependent methyltransferase
MLKCKLCGNKKLKKVIYLGKSPLANNLLKEPKGANLYPLEVNFCPRCYNCQLSYVVDRDELFRGYLYVTSTTKTFRDHFGKMAEDITKEFDLNSKSIVVDIGSNDGLLLKKFNQWGINTIGVEPAENIAKMAIKDGVDTIIDFFNKEVVYAIGEVDGRVDIITANNVFAHTDGLEDMVINVKNLLKDNGVFIIECQYLLDTIKDTTFDNIYHEHIHYFSLMALNEFFKKYEMNIFKVEHIDNHGGSIRVFIQKEEGNKDMDKSVNEFLKAERKMGLHKIEVYKKFAKKSYKTRDDFKKYIKMLKSKKKTIVGYGAPAKATTFLNFCKITNKEIDYVVDDNSLKQGLFIPGVNIPIKSREELDKKLPDYIVILAWNFAPEILKNLEVYKNKGVKFIIAQPKLKII